MLTYLSVLFFIAVGLQGVLPSTETGTTPPPCSVHKNQCSGKADGNHPYYPYDFATGTASSIVNTHYFMQCDAGLAYCQPCFPMSLHFNPQCNQCHYTMNDPCYTTEVWNPVPTYPCPDICKLRDPGFSGNIADPSEPRHYVACWKGIVVACMNCPATYLMFNETVNECLYFGKYRTLPML